MEKKASTQTVHAEVDLDAMIDEVGVAVQRIAAQGKDTRALSHEERVATLAALSKALGLNPLTNPVRFLPMQGGEVLYVTRQATDQIAARLRLNRETVVGPEVREVGTNIRMVFCQVRVTAPDGRSEMATATLPLKDPCNDLMKCETKAKRRATLSLAGLGLLTEEETETIPGARREEPARAAGAPLTTREGIAALGIEQPAPQLPAVVTTDLVADLEAHVCRCGTVRELADLWIAARTDVAALPKGLQARAWRLVGQRAEAIGSSAAAVRAEVQRHDDPGPKGGAPKPSAPEHTEASGAGQDTAPAQEAQATSEAWTMTREGITAHVARIGSARHLESSARQHLREIPETLQLHALHVYAGRAQRLSHDGTSSTPWDECVHRAETWLREGPRVARLPQRTEAAAARRAAVGAR